MNLYKREIYKKSLQHAERRNHKYLYKVGDRYIYPEDVKGKGHSSGGQSFGNVKLKVYPNEYDSLNKETKKRDWSRRFHNVSLDYGNRSKMLAKQGVADIDSDKIRDSKWDMKIANKYRNASEGKPDNTDEYIKDKDLDRRYDHAIEKIKEREYNGEGNSSKAYRYRQYVSKIANEKERKNRRSAIDKEVEENKRARDQKRQFEYKKEWNRKWKAEKAKANSAEQQRKSAHAGYEADKKAFPEGGSTEELERQKRKTALRKRHKK